MRARHNCCERPFQGASQGENTNNNIEERKKGREQGQKTEKEKRKEKKKEPWGDATSFQNIKGGVCDTITVLQ